MNKSKNSYYFDIFILLIIYIVYFFVFLGWRHLSIPDEGRYPEIAREMLSSGNWVTPTINGVPFLDKPPLYYWLEATSMHFFGITPLAIRLPQALFGILGCISIYVFGRYLYSRFAGVLASFILAANVLYFFEAHYANMDLIVATLLLIAFFLCLTSLKQTKTKNKRLLMYAAYFVSALAFLTKGLIAIVFPCMTIFVWMLITNNWYRLKELYVPTGAVLFVVIVTPWLVLAQQQNPDFLYFFFYFQQFYRFVGHGFNNAIGPWFYFVIILAVFLPFSILLLNRLFKGAKIIWQNRKQDSTTLLIALWCLLILIFFSIPSSKIVSYILPIFAPLSLLMALSLEKIIKNNDNVVMFKKMHLIASIIFLVAAVAVIIFSLTQKVLLNTDAPLVYTTLVAVSALIVAFSVKFSFKDQIRKAITLIIFALMLLNVLGQLIIPYFDLRTSEPLVDKVLKDSNSGTIFVYYNRPQPKHFILKEELKQKGYEEDLPILLNNNIYIVYNWNTYKPEIDNWSREFYYGINQYKQAHNGQWPKYLITYPEFTELLNNKDIIIFTPEKQLEKLKQTYPNINFEIKGRYNKNVVVSVVK
ncbi:glycosyltransferase family 39 protein [Francisella tularensis]|uniref:Dolichyl-phosphate-mannose-mannosyltransferase family protein n=5 Tax=Francisella tularensis TaxID=263 RepID=A0AAI8BH74_FRATH|nr:glycosyltransferase family 39 protein [Francisella tularensis]AFX71229.1 dolichyl-phosphate-mannose-protein mannosyltransferase family protein [Francisella tularensis subsp. holarctica F92]EBA53062.1 dolichyl-phosphate-mannose-protein mannosyltransferase [Francisella tularensis subsp. holarctica 257]ABI83351.1 phosphorylase [Francisella tularensis subsp. holarctica OSU18]ABU62170.1 dolichyl-phosphate-mannose-protein mannosyltransferase(PMT) family [Francisella tularensis subsp. holarctica FT